MKMTRMVHSRAYQHEFIPSEFTLASWPGACNVIAVWGFNSKASAQYILAYDTPNMPHDGAGYLNEAVTADASTDKVTLSSHGLSDAQLIRFSAATYPGGISPRKWYYLEDDGTGNAFKVYNDQDLTDQVDITSNGTTVKLWTPRPWAVIYVPAQTNWSFDIPQGGVRLGNGLCVCNSSTAPHKTLGDADVFYTALLGA